MVYFDSKFLQYITYFVIICIVVNYPVALLTISS
jgi:hypothetical protein